MKKSILFFLTMLFLVLTGCSEKTESQTLSVNSHVAFQYIVGNLDYFNSDFEIIRGVKNIGEDSFYIEFVIEDNSECLFVTENQITIAENESYCSEDNQLQITMISELVSGYIESQKID